MRHKSITVVLAIGIVVALLMLIADGSRRHLPNNQEGYRPVQPIAFSHRQHAGELAIDCQYCHSAAEHGRHAGIPAASTCMNCHRFVRSTFGALLAEDKAAKKEKRDIRPVLSPEVAKIYDALALDPKKELASIDGKTPKPIPWVKVYNLPSFVYFDHSPHVVAGVECQYCHGKVQAMERISQFGNLAMGWCVNCHRDVNQNGLNGTRVNASTDCDACHH